MYLLKAVVHNWNDEDAIKILKNCRQAMSSHSRILMIERVLDSEKSTVEKIMDLHMLVIHCGRDSTRDEFDALLKASHFRLANIVAIASGISLVEGIPS